jgi:hypothetical protein
MKKFRRALQILPILLLYCFTVSFYSGNTLLSNAIFLKGTVSHEKSFLSLASINLLSDTTKAENIQIQSHGVSGFSLGNDATLLTSHRIAERTFVNKLSGYFLRSKSIVIKFQSINIIFPFHYFL